MKSPPKTSKKFTMFIYLSLLFFIIFIICGTIFCSISNEIPNIQDIHHQYKTQVAQDKVCVDYLNKVVHKPIWRTSMIISIILSFLITSINISIFSISGSIPKNPSMHYTILFTINLLLIFSVTYASTNLINYHVINPGVT